MSSKSKKVQLPVESKQTRDFWYSLSPNEKKVLLSYLGPGYKKMNPQLFNPKVRVSQLTRNVVTLHRILQKAPRLRRDLRVYRGVAAVCTAPWAKAYTEARQWDLIESRGFMSTAVDPKVSLDFAAHGVKGTQPYMLSVLVPKGTRFIWDPAVNPPKGPPHDEREMLFDAGAGITITRVQKRKVPGYGQKVFNFIYGVCSSCHDGGYYPDSPTPFCSRQRSAQLRKQGRDC